MEEPVSVHQTDTAFAWLMCRSRGVGGGNCTTCIHLSGDPAPFFGGGNPVMRPQPKPTLKTLYRNSLNTLIHQSNPLNPSQPTYRLYHPHLSFPPQKKTPATPPALTLTPYTLDLIQPTRLDSPHLPPPHKHPYATP